MTAHAQQVVIVAGEADVINCDACFVDARSVHVASKASAVGELVDAFLAESHQNRMYAAGYAVQATDLEARTRLQPVSRPAAEAYSRSQ